MYEVRVISEFSGAHRLRHYKGKCEDLHGHNWKVEVVIETERIEKKGMVIDFKKLKENLRKILNALDHKYLNSLPYFRNINPTSENIAKFIYDKLNPRLTTHDRRESHLQRRALFGARRAKSRDNSRLTRVTVWETDTSAASYYES